MPFDTWTKKHTERLYELLDESVIDPLDKNDEHLTDVFNHLEEDDLMKAIWRSRSVISSSLILCRLSLFVFAWRRPLFPGQTKR
mgnify:CR=1 FL=1